MNVNVFAPACLLLGTALLTAGCNMNAQNGVRPGHTETAPSETMVSGEVNRWVRTVGEIDEEPSMSNITSTAVRTGHYNDFRETVELVYEPERRAQVKRNLEDANYYDVDITENGVSYYTQTNADEEMRSILERHYPTAEYTPHDCTRIIGTCAYTVTGGGAEPRHYIRTASFKRGIWTDRVNYDPERDPAGRSDLVEERTFSVAPTGMIKDMAQKLYFEDTVYLVNLRHVERVLLDVEEEVEVARPELAPGDDGDVGLGCTDGTLHAVIGEERKQIGAGGNLTLPVSAKTSVGLECTTANGTMSVGTRCFQKGHLRALFVDDWAALSCFEGEAPATPWVKS
ncbi:MAG: hypothetical protein AAFN27_05155 [Pseudomonadota bacterium]